ncbi:transcription termination factor Rho [Janibacter melonis]|uniref:transcription termination factor Rho n=1 Tax=Janibacter melonis TaxID=262209 RepID=UPI001E4B53A4|nr:transcription termination factor Rho [Janibacter melonis]MCB5990812.1 transcription termination factor Rho [Janibacter melonis]
MRLAQLQQLASSMGITGTAKMRKSDLVAAIKTKQSGSGSAPQAPAAEQGETTAEAKGERAEPRRRRAERPEGSGQGVDSAPQTRDEQPAREEQTRERAQGEDSRGGREQRESRRDDSQQGEQREHRRDRQQGDRQQGDRQGNDSRGERQQGGNDSRGERRDERRDDRQGSRDQGGAQGNRDRQQGNNGPRDDDDEGGRRRRNRGRNRGRDKRRGGAGGGQDQEEVQVHDDDVLVPAAGILDVLDNYAFVRTSGYLPGSNDVYVPLGMVKRHGLRKGDAVTGKVRTSTDGEGMHTVGGKNNRQKYNPLVSLDTVNGMTPDDARRRPEFGKLTPLYPQERLRLETEHNVLTTRMIDLVAPIGKGQRGLIVAPAKAGKTMVMQSIANAITTNNPECHLMVVLVDERPEEVTDMQRAVKGEVISSTFDRPADDHTTVAELAIERAKRLVEMGHDVVVLLDSITKLGRAYNLAAPASGRILSGGVDSAALYPPKKFFGAARNIEDGGSLTILATALVETGSRMDEVIFEEFKGTGNMELKLDRGLANRRIFPAVDINASGTRREEILLAPEELKIMWKLRRVLAALDQQQGVELLIDRLKKTKTNYEFLVQVSQNSSIKMDDDEMA